MTLAAQEEALFDLLFDRERRAAFRRDPQAALAVYGLNEQERRDFSAIRLDALDMDADMRVGLILAQFCRAFPLSFSLASSLPEGLDQLRKLVNATLMRTAPQERIAGFGLALRDELRSSTAFDSARDQALTLSIVEAELGMVWTAQTARLAFLQGHVIAAAAPLEPPPEWQRIPMVLAPHTSAAVLPHAHATLKAELCPCTGAELWRRLLREPFAATRRREIFAQVELRLLLARAVISRPSACDPQAEHVTVELGEGFARLLPHIDGQRSVADILASLRNAGAAEPLLTGVAAGFEQLWRNGMLLPAQA